MSIPKEKKNCRSAIHCITRLVLQVKLAVFDLFLLIKPFVYIVSKLIFQQVMQECPVICLT